MALSGSFYNYPIGEFGLYCEWSGVQDPTTNSTTITLNVYLRYWTINVHARSDGKVNINGVEQTYSTPRIYDMVEPTGWRNYLFCTKTQKVVHNQDGTKNNVPISASWRFSGTYMGMQIGTITASTTVNLNAIPTYTLTQSPGTGSSISVYRSASGYASPGYINVSPYQYLYKGDKLVITFTAQDNYAITTHTVNGSAFPSGGTHTVSGNVAVVSAAQVQASGVGASNANIGSASTVTVTKYNNSYYHSLQYSFGSLSGYITANGSTSGSEVKFSQATVSFTIPSTFYAQIPNSKNGTCTITCRTYSSSSSSTVLGTPTTCSFTVTASQSACAPTVTGTVVDVNSSTVTLTGDNTKLVRYCSTAECTITATAKNSATIASKYINNIVPTDNVVTVTNPSTNTFAFKATDSRGYTTTYNKQPTMVQYISLTCNPTIYRSTATGSTILMDIKGDLYRGSFGAYTNSLTLRYRYKESGGSYGSWTTVSSGITYGTASYSSGNTPINLGNDFDYRKSYVFQVNAYDGANGTTLKSVTKTITVDNGLPVFDWGKSDFNFNVPINVTGGIKIDGDSVNIKHKAVTFTSVPLTTQSGGGAYYYPAGYNPVDYGINGEIIGLMITNWSGASSSFVPYFYNNKISFCSDTSQTVTKIVLMVTYLAETELATKYVVKFMNGSTVLQTVPEVPYNGSAEYTGATPVKQGVVDPENYEFIGWSPSPTNITQDTNCIAQFVYDGEIADSWDVISARSAAGTARDFYAIGDFKQIAVSGTVGTKSINSNYYVYIIGFDHNTNTGRENPGITFATFEIGLGSEQKDICLIDQYYGNVSNQGVLAFNMNHSGNLNYGGWSGSDLRYDILGSTDRAPSGYGSAPTQGRTGYNATTSCATNPVANTLMSCLPADLRAVMKAMVKFTDNVAGGTGDVLSNVTGTIDYLPLLSVYEIWGNTGHANEYETGEGRQQQYEAFWYSHSRHKYKDTSSNTAAIYLLRSPDADNNYCQCSIATDGYSTSGNVSVSFGVAPIFLV